MQRVDSSGNLLWGPTGTRVSLSETNQGDQAIVSDGTRGCIVAWVDTLGDLRINRINSQGIRAWGDSGKYVWNSPASPPMISDRQGGCYILYGIGRLQRLRPDGSTYWPPQGVLIPTGPWIMRLDQVNIYLFGSRYLGYNGQLLFSIHLQKVDSSGSLLWDSLGVILDTLNTNLSLSYDFSTQCGYSTIAWPQNTGGLWDLRTQIVRSDGSTVFQYGGIAVSSFTSRKNVYGVVPSDNVTSIFIWADNRAPGGTFAQRMDTLGQRFWNESDVFVCNPPYSGGGKITNDGSGGLIISGFVQSDFSIRAQQINKYGQLGQVITSVNDIANQVPLEFLLYQNYPNPFNPVTQISYALPEPSHVVLKVFDVLGREVATLVDGYKEAGYYEATWDATNVPSGVYFYKLTAGSYTRVKKMILMR